MTENIPATWQLCVSPTGEVFRALIPYNRDTWNFARMPESNCAFLLDDEMPPPSPAERVSLWRYEYRGMPGVPRYIWGPWEWGPDTVFETVMRHMVNAVAKETPR